MKEFVSPFPEDNDTPEMRTMLENIESEQKNRFK